MKMKAPAAIKMYASCSMTVGSVNSWTPSFRVLNLARFMNDFLSTASHMPTHNTAEPTTKNTKLKRQSKYFAHVAPQSATILSASSIKLYPQSSSKFNYNQI